jgi:hypothetical protein
MVGATLGARVRRLRPPLPLAAVAGVAATLALLLAVSADARARADDFLRAFRRGRSEPLAILDAPLPQVPRVDAQQLAAAVTVELPAGQELGAPWEAQDRVDFNVRWIRRSRPPRTEVFVNQIATLRVDRAALEEALAGAAGAGLRLPRELDTPLQAQIVSAVRFTWDEPEGTLVLWLARPPRLYTTAGPSWEELRARVLPLYALIAPDAAARLAAVRDWDTTVVVPVPPGATTRRVRVDGSESALLVEREGHATVVWQRYGVVHVLDGPLPGRTLARIADTIR